MHGFAGEAGYRPQQTLVFYIQRLFKPVTSFEESSGEAVAVREALGPCGLLPRPWHPVPGGQGARRSLDLRVVSSRETSGEEGRSENRRGPADFWKGTVP